MSHNDPTDSALAAIASIFERPAAKPAEAEPAQAHDDDRADAADRTEPSAAEAAVIEPEIDGYSRCGPGPLEALRFRWTARRDADDNYYVDETIGYASRPISTGPMRKDQVVAYIDQREGEAQRKFDRLREEMAAGARAAQRQQDRDYQRGREAGDETASAAGPADET
ncbi:hypothetical protein [Rhodopseudomonas palustris]|uniref:Uncharacterized protein n=1 Tax=Rhodopseudomonas palustris (strain BisB18) TaxID=316056 RepID=Q215J9_RHOPB